MMNNPLMQNETPQLPQMPSSPSNTCRPTTEGVVGGIHACDHTLTSNTSGATLKTPKMTNRSSHGPSQMDNSDKDYGIKTMSPQEDGTTSQHQALPKCMCNWRNCRPYQKAFRQVKHPSFDGVVKIKLAQNHKESMAYKECLDRTLGIVNPPEWKVSATAAANAAANGKTAAATCKYIIAKHHFTERHMQKYDGDPKAFSFVKPFSEHGAKKYLFTMDMNETLPGDDSTGKLYMQCPNVPKDVVKQEFRQVMEKLKKTPATVSRSSNASQPATISPLHRSNNDKPAKGHLSRYTEDEEDEENNSISVNHHQLALLKRKEEENQRLKESLDAMKSQLTFLHDMVVKLQEHHFDNASYVSSRSKQSIASRNNNKNRQSNVQKRTSAATETTASISRASEGRSRQQTQSKSTKTTKQAVNTQGGDLTSKFSDKKQSAKVQDEIDFNDDDYDIVDVEAQTYISNEQEGDWTETQNELDMDDDDNENEEDDVDEGVSLADRTSLTQSTFKTKYKMIPKSNSSTPTRSEDDDDDEDYDSDQNEEDDDFDLMSLAATTIVSASKSVKSLPREVELDEDDESTSDEDENDEEFDSKSFASRVSQKFKYNQYSSHNDDGTRSIVSFTSQQSRKKSVLPGPKQISANRCVVPGSNKKGNLTTGNVGTNDGGADKAPRASRRRVSIGTSSTASRSNISAGNHEVANMEVTDPYGEKGSYTGSVSLSTGMPHGFGRLEYERAGCWYEGDWKHGQWNGHGRLANGDGDLYEGGLKNDHKHGHGLMRFADGRTFEGEYVNGQMAKGRMTYQDGSLYEGSWEEGMRHGVGICVFTDDSVYEGEFRDGDFNGFGKMTWNDGGWYEGKWMNGEMHGQGIEIRSDGSLRHDGEWIRGQPNRNNQNDSLQHQVLISTDRRISSQQQDRLEFLPEQ